MPLVSDGMGASVWPGCARQRCLKHVRRDCHPALRPRHRSGANSNKSRAFSPERETLTHSKRPTRGTPNGSRISERRRETRLTAQAMPYAPAGNGCRRVRRRCMRLQHLARSGELFRFLDPGLTWDLAPPLPCTSNRIEEEINSPLNHMLLDHRNKPTDHILKACEWTCWKRSTAHQQHKTPNIQGTGTGGHKLLARLGGGKSRMDQPAQPDQMLTHNRLKATTFL